MILFLNRMFQFDSEKEYKYHARNEEQRVPWMIATSHFPTPVCSEHCGKFALRGEKIAGFLLDVFFKKPALFLKLFY